MRRDARIVSESRMRRARDLPMRDGNLSFLALGRHVDDPRPRSSYEGWKLPSYARPLLCLRRPRSSYEGWKLELWRSAARLDYAPAIFL